MEKHPRIFFILLLLLLVASSYSLTSCMGCGREVDRFLEEMSRLEQDDNVEEPQQQTSRSRKRNRRHERIREEKHERKERREPDEVRNKKYEIVFYAWGAGAPTSTGTSPAGHAFVDIPTIGIVGYTVHAETEEDFFGGDNVEVEDESSELRYATYRCAVPITEEQLQRAVAKYREWKNDPPNYFLGRTDCTTFVLDIADAAGVKYGLRVMIQSPAGFLRSLLEHNPQR